MMGGGGGGGNEFARGMVKEHEGLRLDAYKDSKGFLTVGYGHLIDKGSPKDIQKLQEGQSITKERAEALFDQDFIDNFIQLKYEEVQQLRQRPHPHEFFMYYDA